VDALSSHRSLVITGAPGTGKSVSLARLASLLARRDPILGETAQAVPVYLHILDLPLPDEPEEGLIGALIQAAAASATATTAYQRTRFLRTVFRDPQHRVILLIDGLDEFPPARAAAAAARLSTLASRWPQIQIVAAAGAGSAEVLVAAGFYALAIAGWSRPMRLDLARRLGALWNNTILPEARKNAVDVPNIDALLMENWLSAEADSTLANPLEWTLRLWGAYAGDLRGGAAPAVLDAHLARFLPDPAYLSALEKMALVMLRQREPSLAYGEMQQILSSIRVTAGTSTPSAIAPGVGALPPDDVSASTAGSGTRSQKQVRGKATPGDFVLRNLLEAGILSEHAGGQIRFSHPVFLGFLAGMQMDEDTAAQAASAFCGTPSTRVPDSGEEIPIGWYPLQIALHFAAATSSAPDWILPVVQDPEPPLYTRLLNAARWLRDAPVAAEWRIAVLRRLAALIQKDGLPLGMRARIMAAFVASQDPSLAKLVKGLLVSPNKAVRRAAILAVGAMGNPHFLPDLQVLLEETDTEVRETACIAIAALPGDAAQKVIVEVLVTGDEGLRQAAAEALALVPLGTDILQEAAAEPDLLTRRAAVFGIAQVHQPWARKALEKMAVEDGQWVVRNAAAQALESAAGQSAGLPAPLPPPSESGWLLAFAGKLGIGLLAGEPADAILKTALKSGTLQEQAAALQYMRMQDEANAIEAVRSLFIEGPEELHDLALEALHWMEAAACQKNRQEQPMQERTLRA
jgi:HEAT repeat protein